jgi:hypothetical protein
VQRNLGRSGVTSTEDSDVDAWINETIREDICADHNWAGMEFTRTRTLTASDSSYTWQNPTVFKDCKYIAIRYASGQDYQILPEIGIDSLNDHTVWTEQSEGFPRCWARDADGYELRPIPDSTYAIRERVWEYPAEIATGAGGDSSTNFVIDLLPKLLVFGVTARGFLYYEEPELYATWQQAYETELRKAVSVDKRRLSPARLTLKPSTVAGRPTPGLPGFDIGARIPPYGWV